MPLFLAASAIGGAIGFLSGLFGVGGGFLLVPVLHVYAGVPMPQAVGSAACYALGLATTAVLARRPRSGFLELPLILSGGLFAGVLIGTRTLHLLTQWETVEFFGREIPAVDVTVLAAYAVLLLGILIMALKDAAARGSSVRRRGVLSAIRVPPNAVIPDLRPASYSIPVLTWTSLGIGMLSGFLGMSGGLVLIPAAVWLFGLRIHDAITITIVIVWLVSLQSTVLHAVHGNISLPLVAALLTCGAVGAHIGVRVGAGCSADRLKYGFSGMVLAALIVVCGRLASLFGAD
ncbi:MAG: sulfite exporter TauE/SafE family protein [Planctomycetaceae bacterium]|nr:sulfite exporter TauE/SafE family protein [Planctomycetaceae bacterium]